MTSLGHRRPRFAALAAPFVLALSATSVFTPVAAQVTDTALLPPNARAGECYARVWVPEVYQTQTEEILRHAAYETVEVIPAEYETVEERVLVKEASTKLEIVPAQYETVEEEVLVRPAETRFEVVPAEFETVQERVLVKAGYTTWKVGRGPIERIDAATGEIMCLVEIPAEYDTVEKTVISTPATVREVEVPAEYVTVQKQVVVEPARAVEVEVPAEYETVEVRKLVRPAQEVRTTVPAKYDVVEQTVKMSDGHLEWRSILCETNTTPDIIRRLQTALREAGHNPGPIDGSLGAQTQQAVRAFQREHELPTGQLTMETLHKLGVTPQSSI